MFSDQDVREQRRQAYRMLLEVQGTVNAGPIHLYPDHLRTALEDAIDRLEQHVGTVPEL